MFCFLYITVVMILFSEVTSDFVEEIKKNGEFPFLVRIFGRNFNDIVYYKDKDTTCICLGTIIHVKHVLAARKFCSEYVIVKESYVQAGSVDPHNNDTLRIITKKTGYPTQQQFDIPGVFGFDVLTLKDKLPENNYIKAVTVKKDYPAAKEGLLFGLDDVYVPTVFRYTSTMVYSWNECSRFELENKDWEHVWGQNGTNIKIFCVGHPSVDDIFFEWPYGAPFVVKDSTDGRNNFVLTGVFQTYDEDGMSFFMNMSYYYDFIQPFTNIGIN